MNYSIPTPQIPDKNLIPKISIRDEDNISFSFKLMDFNKYFGIDCSCPNWTTDLFNFLKQISGLRKKELLTNKYRTFRVHSLENSNPPCELPSNVDKKSCYQIRIDKSSGGIHGIFYENIFYVFWLDPLHNLYPSDKHGGLRELRESRDWCKQLKDTYEDLQRTNQKLAEENKIYEELFNRK